MLTAADREIAKICVFEFVKNSAYSPPAGAGDGKHMMFQFPPRVTSDGRSGSWTETELPADMPMAFYKTGSARKINLECVYIVGESSSSGAVWGAEQIKFQCSNLKAYFTQSLADQDNFIIKFGYGYHGDPGSTFTCRLDNVDITHKGPYIALGGNWSQAYPLRTDVKITMKLWTQGAASMLGVDRPDPKDVKASIPGLATGIVGVWE